VPANLSDEFINELIEKLIVKFELKRKQSFSPTSVWFGYGSNLDASYFARKMKKHCSELMLKETHPSRATLPDFRLILDNASSGHALAYAIHYQKGECVQGITQEIPFGELANFLMMEGIVSRTKGGKYGVMKNPSYKIIEVDVKSDDGTKPAFSLEGMRSCVLELNEYVEACKSGAETWSLLDSTPFNDDLKWLKTKPRETV
jgi:hypothetical protein